MLNQVNQIRNLNSATKYPSIPTYHGLGQKGRLTDEVTVFDGPVVITEKVDGTNARIVKDSTGDWFIGARENFLTAKGDRIYTVTENIVQTVGEIAEKLIAPTDGYLVYFMEAYGGNIGAQAKQYTANKENFSYRLFDVAHIPSDILEWPLENIALWREQGGQEWLPEQELHLHSNAAGIPLTPRLGVLSGSDLPKSLIETQTWLTQNFFHTQVGLDESAKGAAEGVVLRTLDRKTIAKARHVDYFRTLGI